MIKVYVHGLGGCTPAPLGHYLKALGVLRLVAEQADSSARGWWRDECFWLATELDEGALLKFFLQEYRPSPIVAPWNGGSGFFKTWDEKSESFRNAVACAAVDSFRSARNERFTVIRSALDAADSVVRSVATPIDLSRVPKVERKDLLILDSSGGAVAVDKDLGKDRLINGLLSLPGPFGDVVRALVVALPEDERDWSPLWGRGGTDGKMDFPNVYLRRLLELFDPDKEGTRPYVRELLRSSLFAQAVSLESLLSPSPVGEKERNIGLFDPFAAGGSNMGPGFSGSAGHNPWDFVLMMEGALTFRSAAARRLIAQGRNPGAAAASPFAMWMHGVGGSAADSSDEKGSKFRKFEQWMPLWSQPATRFEIDAVLAEGRVSVGRIPAANAADAARAIARLGVARGIDAFERFGYIERNGQANLATPLGRWRVSPAPHQELLDDIDWWLTSLRRTARGDNASAELRATARACDEAVLDVCRSGSVAERWQGLLVALGNAERVLVASPRRTAKERLRPIPPLSPGWVDAANDKSSDIRLALALASQHALVQPVRELPVRAHWSPVTAKGNAFEIRNESLVLGPDLVCFGRDLEKDCVAMVMRRVMMASRRPKGASYPEGCLPLRAPASCCVSLADVMRFLDGATRDAHILGLARAFMAIDWKRWDREKRANAADEERIDPDYAVFRLAHAPDGVRRGGEQVPIGLDPEASRRLDSRNLAGAAAVALRRLRASGLRPVVRMLTGNATRARRVLASLAFPIMPVDVARCADRITKPFEATEVSNVTHSMEAP